MSKKDYELLADALNWCKPSKIAKPRGYAHRLEEWQGIVTEITDRLAQDNPRFQRGIFLTRVNRERG